MNRNQWMALTFWFLLWSGIMYVGSMYDPVSTLAECNASTAIGMLVNKLVMVISIIAAFACGLCGWLEKERAK